MYYTNSRALLSNWDQVYKIVEDAPETNTWAKDLHSYMSSEISLLWRSELGILIGIYEVKFYCYLKRISMLFCLEVLQALGSRPTRRPETDCA